MSSVLKQGDSLAALMDYVAQVRDRKLDEIRAGAAGECEKLVGAARARARQQVRQALREARADADGRIAVARAAMQSRLRRQRQALTLAALAGVQQRVAASARARWADPAARTLWITMALAEAARSLPAGAWTGRHAPDLGALPAATLPEGVTLELRPDPEIAAGLRLRCGDAEIDATLAGLLREPARVAALWLGELERHRRRGEGAPPDSSTRGQA